jgi:hypothetical protein
MVAGFQEISCFNIMVNFYAVNADKMEELKSEWSEIGGYDQNIKTINGKIIDITCTCQWGSLYPNAWKEGDTLCKHIKKIIKEKHGK